MRFIAFMMMAGSVVAQVTTSPFTRDIDYRGLSEESGRIRFAVEGDVFPTASEVSPNYVRISFLSDCRLADTLVDLETSGGSQANPIYLAVRVTSSDPTTLINLDPTSVSLVRWRSGERDVWLRITQPTSTWLLVGGTPSAPTVDHKAELVFGFTARNSWNSSNVLYNAAKCNLPSNTRWPMEATDPGNDSRGWAISTLSCLDVSASTLEPWPSVYSELHFTTDFLDAATTGVTTAASPFDIVFGAQLPVSLSGDDISARAREFNCPWTQRLVYDVEMLCTANVAEPPDLLGAGFFGIVDFHCDYGWNRYSSLGLEVPVASPDRFLLATDVLGDPVPLMVDGELYYQVRDLTCTVNGINQETLARDTAVFFENNHWVSKSAEFIHLEQSLDNNQFEMIFEGRIYSNVSAISHLVDMSVTVETTNRYDIDDEFPFDGTLDDGDPETGVTHLDQAEACSASRFSYGTQTLNAGEFLACAPFVLNTCVSNQLPDWPDLDIAEIVGLLNNTERCYAEELESNNDYPSAMILGPNQAGVWDLNIVGNIEQADVGAVGNQYLPGYDDIEDFYQLTLTRTTSLVIAIGAEDPAADLDLFVLSTQRPTGDWFTVDVHFNPSIDYGGTAYGYESVARTFQPGTYYIAVSLFEGDPVAQTAYGLLVTENPILMNTFQSESDFDMFAVADWVFSDDTDAIATWQFDETPIAKLGGTKLLPGKYRANLMQIDSFFGETEHSGIESPTFHVPEFGVTVLDFNLSAVHYAPLTPNSFDLYFKMETSPTLDLAWGFSFNEGINGDFVYYGALGANIQGWWRWNSLVFSVGGAPEDFILPAGSDMSFVLASKNEQFHWHFDNIRVFNVATAIPP